MSLNEPKNEEMKQRHDENQRTAEEIFQAKKIKEAKNRRNANILIYIGVGIGAVPLLAFIIFSSLSAERVITTAVTKFFSTIILIGIGVGVSKLFDLAKKKNK